MVSKQDFLEHDQCSDEDGSETMVKSWKTKHLKLVTTAAGQGQSVDLESRVCRAIRAEGAGGSPCGHLTRSQISRSSCLMEDGGRIQMSLMLNLL